MAESVRMGTVITNIVAQNGELLLVLLFHESQNIFKKVECNLLSFSSILPMGPRIA